MEGVLRLHSRAFSFGWAVDALAIGAPGGVVGLQSGLCLDSCVPDMGLTSLGKGVFPASRKALCSATAANPISCLFYPQVPRITWYRVLFAKLKGIQESSLDLGILKELKITLI